jgi:signal transduction histidine kinase
LGIFRDITKRKIIERELKDAHEILIKNNRELQQAKEKAEESDRLKSAFLATMSHELRTPLISIIGLSELMDSSMSMEEVLEFAQSIHKSGAQLDSLIDDIFNVSQLEAGNLKPTIEEFEVNDILRNVQNQGYTQLADAGKNAISLKLDCPENMGDLWIRSDKAMFQKIFQILIHNAIKFTTEGDIIFGFKISGENKPCFFVKDNGIGIPIDKQHLLFERFRQLDQNHNRLYGGIGLGLYSSKKMVEALGGKIWFDSMDGKGSTFYFLPGSSKSTSV